MHTQNKADFRLPTYIFKNRNFETNYYFKDQIFPG